MTISATTQGLRPGVCTSTSRPSSPFDGMVIYETDTNRVLVWDNSAWVMIADTDSPPGLQLIKTQTVGTTVSSVAVTAAFSADYEHYRIIYAGGVASADISLLMTLGATATGYYFASTGRRYDATDSPSQGANTTSWPFGFGSTNMVTGSCDVYAPFLAKNTMFSGTAVNASTAAATNLFRTTGGYLANTTSYTDFTLTTSSGTITGGTIRVYGYRNS